MKTLTRGRAIVAAALLIGLCAAGAGWWLRSRSASPKALLRRLPRRDAVVVSVDFAALRKTGILKALAGAKTAQDADYKAFIEKTGFDYARDLDLAVVSFAPEGKYLAVSGRFDWDRLNRYVASEQGKCEGDFCRMAGSAPERRISFFPLRSNLMALAVGRDDSAALRLNSEGPEAELVPDAPLWIAIPPAVLQASNALPTGTRMFARPVSNASSVTLSFAPEGGRLAARLQVRCASVADAADIASQLSRTTTLLQELIAREHQRPNPADLSGVLASGAFRAEGASVHGYWPMERAFLENLFGQL